MKKFRKIKLVLAPLLAANLASCATLPNHADEQQARCPVIESGKWYAWIEPKRTGHNGFVLNINGEVVLPTPAYELALASGPMDRAMPPGQRFNLEVRETGAMALQVISKLPVRYREATPYPRYRSIMILCEGKELASIPDVTIME